MSYVMTGGSYSKIGRRHHGHGGRGGFRLNPRRFSVQRLRARFVCMFKLLSRWRSSYGHAVQFLKRNMSRSCRSSSSFRKSTSITSSRNSFMMDVETSAAGCRIRTFGRSNSFYSEAIADCLEFIKSSSISPVEQKQVCPR